MLTRTLLSFTTAGAEWVLWLLVLLSVVSVGVMIERALFFAHRRLPDPDGLSRLLLEGDLAGARAAVHGREGMEAEVVRAAVDTAARGSGAVTEVVNAQLERARLEYQRRLGCLGTLGRPTAARPPGPPWRW